MTDLLGPANAANTVTTEPADSRVFGSSDTFFIDATSSTANNGTQIGASFLNGVLQQIRTLVRGCNIAVDNTNASMLLQAVQTVAPPFAADTGSAGALAVNVNQPGFALNPGQSIWVKIANTAPGPTTITLTNSAGPTTNFGTFNVTRGDATALRTYDLVQNQIATLIYDGTQFQIEKPFLPGETGDLKWAAAGVSQTGFVPLNGLTIGNGSSGATGLAGALAASLYAFHWDNFSNTLCPVAGGRGAAAAADFAAGKTIQLLDYQCKTPIGVDAMGGAAATNRLSGVPVTAGAAATAGSTLGEALHALSTAELASHSHGVTDPEHSHSYTDPGHGHGVTDPGHDHSVTVPAAGGDGINGTSPGPEGANYGTSSPPTSGNTTGISINSSDVGITVHSASTGITINNAGSGTAHNNTPLAMTAVAFARL